MDTKIVTIPHPILSLAECTPLGANLFLIQWMRYLGKCAAVTGVSPRRLEDCIDEIVVNYWVEEAVISDRSDEQIITQLKAMAKTAVTPALQRTVAEVFTAAALSKLDDPALEPMARHLSFFSKVNQMVLQEGLKGQLADASKLKKFQGLLGSAIKAPKAEERILHRLELLSGPMDKKEFKDLINRIFEDQAEFMRTQTKSKPTVPSGAGFGSTPAGVASGSGFSSASTPGTPRPALRTSGSGMPIRCRICGILGSHYAEACPSATQEQRTAAAREHREFLARRTTYANATASSNGARGASTLGSSQATTTNTSATGPTTRSQTGTMPGPPARFVPGSTNTTGAKPVRAVSTEEKPAYFKGFVGNAKVPVEILPDTGSAVSVISSYFLVKLEEMKIMPTTETAVQADGITPLRVLGESWIDISTEGEPLAVKFLVVASSEPMVLVSNAVCMTLGCDASSMVRQALDMRKPKMVANITNFIEDEEVLTPTEIPTGAMDIPAIEALFPIIKEVSEKQAAPIIKFYELLPEMLYQGLEAMAGPEMTVELKDENATSIAHARSFPPRARDFLIHERARLLQLGQIEEAPPNMRFSSVMFPVPKGPDDFRAVIDYVATNKFIIPTTYPMPRFDDDTDFLAKSKFWGVLDAEKGYNQVPLDEMASRVLCVQILDRLFLPRRLFPGVLTATAFFQQAMSMALSAPLSTQQLADCMFSAPGIEQDAFHVKVWLDDSRIDADTLENYLGRLERTLVRLKAARIRLNLKKSVMLSSEVRHCGRCYSQDGIRFDPERVQALAETPIPTTTVQLMSFINSVNWNRESIMKFTEIAAPMYELLENAYAKAGGRSKTQVKRVPLEWTEEANASFMATKAALAAEIRRDFPRHDHTLFMFSDASKDFWSACLMQAPKDEDHLPFVERSFRLLGFASGSFSTQAQQNWDTQSKEAHGFLSGLHKFRFMLISKVWLVVDHKNFLDIMVSTEISEKMTQSRVYRWRQTVANYEHAFLWLEGETIPYVDYLTRDGAPFPKRVSFVAEVNHCCAISLLGSPLSSKWDLPKVDSTEFIQASQKMEEVEGFSKDQIGNWRNKDGIIYIPSKELQLLTLVAAHCGSGLHLGLKNMLDSMKELCFWNGMRQDAENFNRDCLHCIIGADGNKTPRPYGQLVMGKVPGEVIQVDFLDMEKDSTKKYLFVIVDTCSGFTNMVPTENVTAAAAVGGLIQWVSAYGAPQWIISDAGGAFLADVTKKLMDSFRSKHHIVSAHIHTGNGQVERKNREILKVFTSLMSELQIHADQWNCLTNMVQLGINNARRQRLGGLAPCQVFLGREPVNPLSYLLIVSPHVTQEVKLLEYEAEFTENIIKYVEAKAKERLTLIEIVQEAGRKRREANDKMQAKQAIPMDIIVGDMVLLACSVRRRKLQSQWLGPYLVTEILGSHVVRVKDMITGALQTAHIARLHKYSNLLRHSEEDLKEQIAYFSDSLSIEKVVGYRIIGGICELEIHWEGFENENNTWEPADYIYEVASDAVMAYLETLDSKQRSKLKRKIIKPAP
jgi:hypothetical protein